jgi:hypothetical protein
VAVKLLIIILGLLASRATAKPKYETELVFCVGEAGVASVKIYYPWKDKPCRVRFRRPAGGRRKTTNTYPSSLKACRAKQKKTQESLELKNWKCA